MTKTAPLTVATKTPPGPENLLNSGAQCQWMAVDGDVAVSLPLRVRPAA